MAPLMPLPRTTATATLRPHPSVLLKMTCPSASRMLSIQNTRLPTRSPRTPDSACRLHAPCYQSKCTQKYVYHRMVSVDPCDPYRGFFIDTYKLPSACSCHIPQ